MRILNETRLLMKSYLLLIIMAIVVSCNDSIEADNTTIESSPTSKNQDYNIQEYLNEAKKIMGLLDIKTRDSIKYDGTIKININDTLPYMNAIFWGYDEIWADSNYKTRSYGKPLIEISRQLDSVITNKYFFSDSLLIRSKSHVIHEMVHYLQETEDNISTTELAEYAMRDEKKYVSVPSELEAHAVMSYYWLRYYKPEELQKIMRAEMTNDKRLKTLIDAARKTQNKRLLFNP